MTSTQQRMRCGKVFRRRWKSTTTSTLTNFETEKLRLKWRSLWNAYKAYVKECDKTGTGLDTILDTPPFYDEIADIVSSSKAVHLDYVSDTFCPTDQTKWSLETFQSKVQKAAGHSKKAKANKASTEEIDDNYEDSVFATPSHSASAKHSESDSTDTAPEKSVKQRKRQSRHEQLVSIMISQAQERRKEREEARQERRVVEHKREMLRAQRHTERITVANSLIETMRSLSGKSAKKHQKQDSDTE